MWIRNAFTAFLLTACCCVNADDEISSTLSDAEAEEVVAEHNRIREEAGVVVEIGWDNELAAVAQEWAVELAKTDMLAHRPENMHGENIALVVGRTILGCRRSAGVGVGEEHYHGEAIDEENFATFGHYTQVIWDRTTLVGCGRAVSATGGVYVVCNYSAAGNVLGEKPITIVEDDEVDAP